MAIEGSRRPHYYSPLYVPEESAPGGLISVLLPAIQKSRVFARVLSARAMLHLGENRVDAAWQDVLACHRIGRLVGRGPTLIEGLVAIAIDGLANSTSLTLLRHAPPTAEQAAQYLRDLDALPPLPKISNLLPRIKQVASISTARMIGSMLFSMQSRLVAILDSSIFKIIFFSIYFIYSISNFF